MIKDPGLMTDSTGEGMAGATDVRLDTQDELRTLYNGSKECPACGALMNPVESLHSMQLCPTCARKDRAKKLKNRMA